MTDSAGNSRIPPIGEKMPEGDLHAGWIYMGPDEETGKDFYAAAKDEPGGYGYVSATEAAKKVHARVPTPSELDKLYRYKNAGALKNTFNEAGFKLDRRYWAEWSGQVNDGLVQDFKDGERYIDSKSGNFRLRLVCN